MSNRNKTSSPGVRDHCSTGYRNQHDSITIWLKANYLETGWCEKKARPPLPLQSKVEALLRGWRCEKKAPGDLVAETVPHSSTLDSGGGGFFFAPTGTQHKCPSLQCEPMSNRNQTSKSNMRDPTAMGTSIKLIQRPRPDSCGTLGI